MSNINLNGVRVDDQTGRVSFSGVQSGIDTEGAVNNIITARRIPIDRIETEIDRNREIIAGVSDWRTLMRDLQSKASVLYGQISLDNNSDVFESKQAFANTTREDGATPSQAGALLGVTLDNDAELATQSFEILQRATRMEITSADLIDPDGAADTGLGLVNTFRLATDATTFPPTTNDIVITATDSLFDVRDKINLANRGANASGVSAQIVNVTADDPATAGNDPGVKLVLTADRAGETITHFQVAGPNSVLRAVDIIQQTGPVNVDATQTDRYTVIAAEPQTAQIALTDVPNAEGGVVSQTFLNPTDVLVTTADAVDITIEDQEGAFDLLNAPVAITVPGGAVRALDILGAVAASRPGADVAPINLPPGVEWREMDAGRYVFFELDVNDDGTQALRAFATENNDYLSADRRAINLNFASATAGVAEQFEDALDFNFEPTIIERQTNQIDDLFEGVTLDLLKAEPGTNIELDIERDLNTVKTALTDFVEAYNEVVRFGNLQRQVDPLTGLPVEDASLFQTSILSQTESLFNLIGSEPAAGSQGFDPITLQSVGLDFRTLAQVGIDFISLDASEANPLERGTLTIDDADLDNALLTNFEGVEFLFSTEFVSSEPSFVIQSFDGNTNFTNGGGIQINITNAQFLAEADDVTYQLLDASGAVIPGQVGTASVFASGRVVFNDDGPANGLTAFFTDVAAGADANVDISMTKGIGNNFFFGLDRLVDPDVGSLSSEIDAREADNELKQTRVEEQLERLDRERIRLTEQFNRMEAALAELESLKQQVAAAFGETGSE